MRIKYHNEQLTPKDIARRLLNISLEDLALWHEREEFQENPLTDKQKQVVDAQVDKMIESIRKRYKATWNAGRKPDQGGK